MKIFLDTADIDEIRAANETGLIDGVTTNPTLILRAGRTLEDVAKQLIEEFPHFESVSTEVVADTSEEMIAQAQKFIGLGPAITIKLPCTIEGLKACKVLNKAGVKTNVTLIFSAAQAVLAAKSGATYVSPFVGRLNDNSFSGIALIQDIARVYERQFTTTQILAASVRDVSQVSQCFDVGANVCTLPPKVFWGMYNHILTDKGLELFNRDWAAVHGTN